MTDTSPKAVVRFSIDRPNRTMVYRELGDYVRYSDYAALSAQLEAANLRHAAAIEAVPTAGQRLIQSAKEALEIASVEPVTVQQAARVLLSDDSTISDLAIDIMRNNRLIEGRRIGYHPALIAALRAIAGEKP